MIGLYVHIPFCKHICSYCDFYKMVVSKQLQKKTIDYIIKEMDLRNISQYNFSTIYIGGGSPSSLDDELFDYFLFNLAERTKKSLIKEFSIEFNPEDITLSKVLILKKYNVNRISIGVQSFNEKIIKKLGRNPFVNKMELESKIALLNQVGITNINVDLIYAVDGQNLDMVNNDITQLLSLNITHLSCYALILEDHTILNYQHHQGLYHCINDELDEAMYVLINKKCQAAGFEQYETSNYALKGFYSKHNLLYWHNESYLGIGPSAASHIDNIRFTNIDKLESYFKGIDDNSFNYKEYYEETTQDILETTLMLGLRLSKGISEQEYFEKCKKNLIDAFPKILNLINEGLLERGNGFIYIPSKYSYIANYIIVKIIS